MAKTQGDGPILAEAVTGRDAVQPRVVLQRDGGRAAGKRTAVPARKDVGQVMDIDDLNEAVIDLRDCIHRIEQAEAVIRQYGPTDAAEMASDLALMVGDTLRDYEGRYALACQKEEQ